MVRWTINIASALAAAVAALVTFVCFVSGIFNYNPLTSFHNEILKASVSIGVSLALALFVAWVFAFGWRSSVVAGLALMLSTTALFLSLQYYLIIGSGAFGFSEDTVIDEVANYVQRAIVPWLPPVFLGVSLIGTVASFIFAVSPPARSMWAH